MCAVRFCSPVSQFVPRYPDFPAFYLFCSLPACCCHITLLWSFFYISQCLLGTLSFNYFVLLTFPFLFCQLISSLKGSPFAQLPLTFCVCIFGPSSPHSNTSRLNQQKCVTLSYFEVAFYMNTGRHNFTACTKSPFQDFKWNSTFLNFVCMLVFNFIKTQFNQFIKKKKT